MADLDNFIPDSPPADHFIPTQPFVDPRDVRSSMSEIGAAAKRGLYQGASGLGAALQTPDERAGSQPGVIARAGKAIEDWGNQGAQAPENQAQSASHGPVTNLISQAAEGLTSFVPTLAAQYGVGAVGGAAAGAVGGPAGALVGGIAGAAAGAGGYTAAQTWHQDYQKALQGGLNDAAARDHADKSALLQGGVMAAGGAVGGAVGAGGSMIARAAGFGAKDAAEAGADAVGKKFIPEFAKRAAQTTTANTSLSMAGAGGQAAVDQSDGLETPTPWEAAKAAITPSLGASLGFLPLAAMGAHTNARTAENVRTKLADANADPADRMKAAAIVYDAIQGTQSGDGASAAAMWRMNATKAIERDEPIGMDNSWTDGPHQSVYPEAAGYPEAASEPKTDVVEDGAIGSSPFAAMGAQANQKTAENVRDKLADAAANPADRAKAAGMVYDAMKAQSDENSPGAEMWRMNAIQAIKDGKPIGMDNSWTDGPHESVYPEAAGAMSDAGAKEDGLPGLPPEHVALFGRPAAVLGDLYGAREMSDQEQASVSSALSASEDAGHNPSMFDNTTIHTYEPGPGDGPARYFPASDQIGLRADVVRAIARGVPGIKERAVGWLRHEGWHRLDRDSAGDFQSSTHPAFDIGGGAGSREALGGIMKEAHDAWANDAEPSEHLDYPFHMWDDSGDIHGKSDDELSEIIRNEVFAQLGRMHDEHPEMMRSELPKAYKLFQRIKNANQSSSTDAEARGGVRQTLQTTGADGGDTDAVAGGAEGKAASGAGRWQALSGVGGEGHNQRSTRAIQGRR